MELNQLIPGIIHGKTIELQKSPGLADGQEVEVMVRPATAGKKWGEGILRSAGGWAEYPEMEGVMEKIHQERKRPSFPGS